MKLDSNWFTEVCDECGSAFSLKIKQKLHEEQTPFQKIEIYETESYGNLMTIDGFVMLTELDNFLYHEMMSHPALFIHPQPQRVLIVGGGDCGTLREVLRHKQLIQIQQVDIDERVTRLSEQYFPQLVSSNDDPRAELYFDDGIQWVKQAEAGYYDVIIVDSTDPIGPAEGLFNVAFYRDCYRALGDQGVLVQQSESPVSHQALIKDIRKAMRDAGFEALHTLDFPQPVYPSGWWTATMAGKRIDLATVRQDDITNKGFTTQYYSLNRHLAAMEKSLFFEFLGE